METKPYRNWWFLTLNGMIFILFGLLLFFSEPSLISKIILYTGVAISLTGILLLTISVYSIKKEKRAALTLVQAVISLTIGIIILITPKDTTLIYFSLMAGIWAITIGIFQLAVLVNIGKVIPNRNIFLFNGLLTIALGLILCIRLFEITGVMARLIGGFTVILGAILTWLSVLLKNPKITKPDSTEPK